MYPTTHDNPTNLASTLRPPLVRQDPHDDHALPRTTNPRPPHDPSTNSTLSGNNGGLYVRHTTHLMPTIQQ